MSSDCVGRIVTVKMGDRHVNLHVRFPCSRKAVALSLRLALLSAPVSNRHFVPLDFPDKTLHLTTVEQLLPYTPPGYTLSYTQWNPRLARAPQNKLHGFSTTDTRDYPEHHHGLVVYEPRVGIMMQESCMASEMLRDLGDRPFEKRYELLAALHGPLKFRNVDKYKFYRSHFDADKEYLKGPDLPGFHSSDTISLSYNRSKNVTCTGRKVPAVKIRNFIQIVKSFPPSHLNVISFQNGKGNLELVVQSSESSSLVGRPVYLGDLRSKYNHLRWLGALGEGREAVSFRSFREHYSHLYQNLEQYE